ncbi:MAG: hypothetical protein J6C60_02935 [Alistipes sp.]|nr:hypothetical protein [Alistipes sp.]MBO5399745.1 hypothetical protein [Alistipes sp.]MBP3474008.1 hypothetical protein [Alistipes sp.]
MKKILLLVAVEAEIGAQGIEQLKGACDICFVGVGKLRAYETTLAALAQGEYEVVINIGTCGSFRHPFGTLLQPSAVVQGDIYIDSIFSTEPELLGTGDEGCSIASSDNFIGADTPAEQRRLIEPHDCMDMESYAIVRATKFYARQSGKAVPQIYMFKVVSDACDGTIEDWESRVERLRPTLIEAARELIAELK